MNSVPCTLSAGDPPVAGNTEGMCRPEDSSPFCGGRGNDAVNISSWLATPVAADEAINGPCFNARGLRNRVWCQQGLEWLWPAITVLGSLSLAAALWAYTTYGPKAKEAPKKEKLQLPLRPVNGEFGDGL